MTESLSESFDFPLGPELVGPEFPACSGRLAILLKLRCLMNNIYPYCLRWLTILTFTQCCFGSLALAGAVSDQEDGKTISVMTQNLFMGTDFPELVAARNFDEFVQAVTITYRKVLATQPKTRMAAIAKEISIFKPDFIGLQEAAIIRTAPTTFPATPAVQVEIDLLGSLLSELKKLAQPYQVIAILKGLDAQAPGVEGKDVRFTVQDALLIRLDKWKKDFKIFDVVVKEYQSQLVVNTAVGPFTNVAGFLSTVIQSKGKKFRFVTTHLAVPFISGIDIPFTQSSELIDFIFNTDQTIPTIAVGDFNSSANNADDPSHATYANLINSGLEDSWLATHPYKPGPTCCQNPDLKNINSVLSQRIDLVLSKNLKAMDAKLIGNKSSDRIQVIEVWPSDHAGVFVRFGS